MILLKFKKIGKEYPGKLKIVHVLSCEEPSLEECETGFISAKIIEKYCDFKNCTFFICGPQIMYDFVQNQLNEFKLPQKRIRREAFGEIKDVINFPGFPKDLAEKTFKIKVRVNKITKDIPAISTESVLVALERANLAPLSKCRSGECGFCRSLLLSGNLYINPVSDWRRAADKKFNHFHPCSSYPVSDLEIRILNHL